MKHLLSALTRRQKIALSIMIAANAAALALTVVALRGNTVVPAYTPVPTPDCGSIAARLLAQRGIAGSASLGPDNILRLHLTGLDVSGQPLSSQPSDVAWDALAAMLVLPRVGCGPYPFVEVDVPAPESEVSNIRLLVSVDWIDLQAWGYGELDDGELAGRLQTTLYVQPAITTNDE